jgi:hypothetical protein
MVAYATEGLIEKLIPLTTDQRAAIDRIVDHVYIRNQPIAHLLTGDDKICTESNYYRNGTMDPATGKWKRKPGWGKDPAFVEALQEAARLALTARTREELTAWAEAKRRARLATPDVVQGMIAIATGYELQRDARGRPVIDHATGQLAVARRMAEDKDAIAAGKALLDYARLDTVAAAGEAEQSEELEWWRATDDDNDAA